MGPHLAAPRTCVLKGMLSHEQSKRNGSGESKSVEMVSCEK